MDQCIEGQVGMMHEVLYFQKILHVELQNISVATLHSTQIVNTARIDAKVILTKNDERLGCVRPLSP